MSSIHKPGPIEDVIGRAGLILRAGYRVKGPFAIGRHGMAVPTNDPRRTAVCAQGAIEVAADVLGSDGRTRYASTDMLDAAAAKIFGDYRLMDYTDYGGGGVYWHDHPDTTDAQVAEVFALAEQDARTAGV